MIERDDCNDYALDVETPTDKLYASKGCIHVWERVGWTLAYRVLEDTTYTGEHRIGPDPSWFWPIVQCKACKKVRIDKIYVSRKEVEEQEAEDTTDTVAENEKKAVGEELFKKGFHRCSVLD